MTTTRYFEVKVTGCMNCPNYLDEFGSCKLDCINKNIAAYRGDYTLTRDNEMQITQSCPMWDKTKESETK